MEDSVKRLELVTSRLEALEARLSQGGSGTGPSLAAPAAPALQGDVAFVKAYDVLLADFFSPVESGAKSLESPDVQSIVNAFKEALSAQRQMLVVASRCKKPSQADLQKVLKPTSDLMAKVDSLKDRRSKCFNHLSMVAEGVACLQWVCIEPTPAPFMGDVIPGSEMYGNKVIMEYKGKDEKHVNFAKDFKTFLLELQKYVKSNHTTGLCWNPSGSTDYSSSSAGGMPSAPAAPKAPPPPGPPPPPPPGFFNDVSKQAGSKPAAGGHAALFAELEAKGQAAAAGLKKVSKDQMTHKNPALRASSVVLASSVRSSDATSNAPSTSAAKKPPRMENVGSKWFIENFEANEELQVTDASPKTAVLFAKNVKSLLQVPDKINTLSIDSCVKCRVIVGSCVASIEIINCNGLQLQVTGTTPMITMDGSSGVIIYLSKQCVDDDIAVVSSKCSEMNIVIPNKCEDDDPVEIPIPEQFETRVRNGKLETHPISHVGA